MNGRVEDIDLELEDNNAGGSPVVEKTVTPEEGIADFKRQLQEERVARLAAEQKAFDAENRIGQSEKEVQDNNYHLLSTAIETSKRDSSILKGELAAAWRNGDFDRAAELQEQISSNSARILNLENGKAAMDEQRANPRPSPRVNSDPVEALASQLTPRSAAWIRAHPEFARDQSKMAKMVAAHNFVVSDGAVGDTDEYFARVEQMLGVGSSDVHVNGQDDDPFSDAAALTSRRTAPPAAPPSRGSGPGTTNPNKVRLSSAEVEMAEMMGMSPEEYAKNKLALKKEGRLN